MRAPHCYGQFCRDDQVAASCSCTCRFCRERPADDDFQRQKAQYAALRAALQAAGEDVDRALWDDDLGIGLDTTKPIDSDLARRLLVEAGVIEDPFVLATDLQHLLAELS